jgi:hypothetical protein
MVLHLRKEELYMDVYNTVSGWKYVVKGRNKTMNYLHLKVVVPDGNATNREEGK